MRLENPKVLVRKIEHQRFQGVQIAKLKSGKLCYFFIFRPFKSLDFGTPNLHSNLVHK